MTVAVVAIKHPDPIFEGQTKTKMLPCCAADATKAVFTVTGDELQLYLTATWKFKGVTGCAESSQIRRAEEKGQDQHADQIQFLL